MDLIDLKRKIENNDYSRVDSMKLRFVEKRERSYTSYIPEITGNLRREIANMYSRILTLDFFQNTQVPYNEIGKEEDTLEIAELEIANINTVIEAISEQQNVAQDLSEMELDDINFYVVEILINNEKVFLFRRFNKQKKLRKGIRGQFTGNGFVQLEAEVIGLDNEIDIIVFSNEALIVNRFSLQTIFDLSDYFMGKSDQAMGVIGGYNKINNFDSFRIDCMNDGTAIKRLTKIINTPNLIQGFFSNINNLPMVIIDASLTITTDETGNIDYNGTREERTQILSCIADKYYITLLQGVVGEDKLK